MKNLLIILFMFFYTSSFSQINCGNAPTLTEKGDSVNGERNGIWYEFLDGHLYSTGNYVNGKKDGTWKHFFFDNEKKGDFSIKNQKRLKISYISNFSEGLRDGNSTGYYIDGKKIDDIAFLNDSLIHRTKYYPNGEIKKIIRYDSTSSEGLPYVREYIRHKGSKGYMTYENFYDPVKGKPCYDHKLKKMVNKIIDDYNIETADGSYKTWITKTGECFEYYVIEDGRKRLIFRH